MNVIVTGATSFIGAAVVRQLLERGDRVCAVVRPGSAHLHHLTDQVPDDRRMDMQIEELDLTDIAQLAERLAGGSPAPKRPGSGLGPAPAEPGNTSAPLSSVWDAWIQIGWDGAGSDNRKNRQVQQQNAANSLAALQTAARLGCRRFLFTGSQAEYGIHAGVTTEETPCHPVSEYGKAKLEFLNLAKDLCKTEKIEYIHTRIYSVYGPGDHPWSLVNSCLSAWQTGGTMEFGDCTQMWNFLYIEDAAEALLCLLTEGRPGVYNIAGEDTRILREFIEEMYRLCGEQGSFSYGKRPPNAEGVVSLMPDISRIKRETGWRPRTSFTEGIYETMYRLRAATS